MRYQDNTRYTSDSPNGRGHNRANLLKALRFVLRRSYLELIDHSRREILSRVSGKLDGETERASVRELAIRRGKRSASRTNNPAKIYSTERRPTTFHFCLLTRLLFAK